MAMSNGGTHKGGGNRKLAVVDPTQKEIAERAAECRATWTAERWRKQRGENPDDQKPWTPPVIPVVDVEYEARSFSETVI